MELNTTLIQPNAITQARYSFNEYEMRIFFYIVHKLKNHSERKDLEYYKALWKGKNLLLQFQLSEIKIKEEDQNHSRLKKALFSLVDKGFYVETQKEWYKAKFLNFAHFDKESKKYEIEIPWLLLPHMLNLVDGYTKYQLNVVLYLTNQTQRLYMMMSQFTSTGTFKIKASDLRYKLGLENNYERYCNFKLRILTKAEKELKKSFDEGRADLYFTLIQDKRKRNIEDDFDRILEFKITTTEQKKKENEILKAETFHTCSNILKSTFFENQKEIELIFNHLENINKIEEFTKRACRFEKEALKRGIPMSKDAAKLMFILKEDFGYKK